MSCRQLGEIVAAVIVKPVRFVDESPEQARARRVREGVPPAVTESVLAIGAYQRAGGKTVTITSTIADLSGRPARRPTNPFPSIRLPSRTDRAKRRDPSRATAGSATTRPRVYTAKGGK